MSTLDKILSSYAAIFPFLCVVIFALLIAIIICLILMLRIQKKDMEKQAENENTVSPLPDITTTPEYKKIQEKADYWHNLYQSLSDDYHTLKVDSNRIEKQCKQYETTCAELKKQLTEAKDTLKKQKMKTKDTLEKQNELEDKLRTQNIASRQLQNTIKCLKQQLVNQQKETKTWKYYYLEDNVLENEFYISFKDYYRLKNDPILTRSEGKLLRGMYKLFSFEKISEAPKENISQNNTFDEETTFLFPQVSLHSLIDFTDMGMKRNSEPGVHNYFLNLFRSKHVDFLLCTQKENGFFIPKLGIELDDTTHLEEDIQKNDQVKDKLFEAAQIPLLRIKTYKRDENNKIVYKDLEELEEELAEKISVYLH